MPVNGGWMELVALAISVIDSLVDRLEGHRGKCTANFDAALVWVHYVVHAQAPSLRKTLKEVLRFAVTGVLPANLDSHGKSRPADVDGVERRAMGDSSTPAAGRDRGALQQTLARTPLEDK